MHYRDWMHYIYAKFRLQIQIQIMCHTFSGKSIQYIIICVQNINPFFFSNGVHIMQLNLKQEFY